MLVNNYVGRVGRMSLGGGDIQSIEEKEWLLELLAQGVCEHYFEMYFKEKNEVII